jgi:hypothetical protein
VLGPSAWRLANQCGRNRLIAVCHDHVRALAEAAVETAHLAVREGSQALLLDNAVAQGRVVMVSGLGGRVRRPLQHGHGKALLADCDLEEIETILGDVTLRPTARRTLVSLARIAAACAKVRVEGTAIDDREFLDEVRCVGRVDPRRRRTDRGVGGYLRADLALPAEALRSHQDPGRHRGPGDHEGAGAVASARAGGQRRLRRKRSIHRATEATEDERSIFLRPIR